MAEMIFTSAEELLKMVEADRKATIDEYRRFPQFMDRDQAAEYINRSKSLINKLIKPTMVDGLRPPAQLKVNSLGLIDKADLDELLNTKY